MGSYALLPLPDQAALTRTEHGYLFRAGQQDSHLEVTLTEDGLRFVDTGTGRFRKLARVCQEEDVAAGIAAVCPLPDGVTAAAPVLVEFWPRLGDDHLDASTLPDTVAMTMLSDAGDDAAHFGAGPDFYNGFTGVDQVWGGGGNDWIRAGKGDDQVWGGAGDDQLVGTEGGTRSTARTATTCSAAASATTASTAARARTCSAARPASTRCGPTPPTGCAPASRWSGPRRIAYGARSGRSTSAHAR